MPQPTPTPAALQSISIVRTERRTNPSPTHTVYAILVSLPVRNWTVYRRYSEFLKLHEELCKSGHIPPFPLPGKQSIRRWFGSSDEEEARIKERKEMLERYLRGIVSSLDGTWREMECFREFIELPQSQGLSKASPKQKYIPGSYSESRPTRQLGVGGTPPSPPVQAQETTTTRQLTSDELFTNQQKQFDQQDSHLNDLTAILRRQRQMGMAINQELLEQNELLDALDGEVQQTQGRLDRNDGLVRKLG